MNSEGFRNLLYAWSYKKKGKEETKHLNAHDVDATKVQ
jgi:hypothetical protein